MTLNRRIGEMIDREKGGKPFRPSEVMAADQFVHARMMVCGF
ncbi:hypothetical protein [Hyphomonas sp. UBA3195]|nr:hypothetical protein [Hyphomonas sp. UBA3195]